MSRERERAEAAGRDEVVRRLAEHRVQHLVGLRSSRRDRRSRGPAAGRRGRARRATAGRRASCGATPAASPPSARCSAWPRSRSAAGCSPRRPPAEAQPAGWWRRRTIRGARRRAAARSAVRLAAAVPRDQSLACHGISLDGGEVGRGPGPLPHRCSSLRVPRYPCSRRGDVRERVRVGHAARVHSVAELLVVRRLVRPGARTLRSGTSAVPHGRSRGGRCRRRRPPAGGCWGSRTGRRRARRAGRAWPWRPSRPGQAPLTPGLTAVFRRSRSACVLPV